MPRVDPRFSPVADGTRAAQKLRIMIHATIEIAELNGVIGGSQNGFLEASKGESQLLFERKQRCGDRDPGPSVPSSVTACLPAPAAKR
jgi:hypothetical protein